jgi:hypothetical protein
MSPLNLMWPAENLSDRIAEKRVQLGRLDVQSPIGSLPGLANQIVASPRKDWWLLASLQIRGAEGARIDQHGE